MRRCMQTVCLTRCHLSASCSLPTSSAFRKVNIDIKSTFCERSLHTDLSILYPEAHIICPSRTKWRRIRFFASLSVTTNSAFRKVNIAVKSTLCRILLRRQNHFPSKHPESLCFQRVESPPPNPPQPSSAQPRALTQPFSCAEGGEGAPGPFLNIMFIR
jgi:hypothetical protein